MGIPIFLSAWNNIRVCACTPSFAEISRIAPSKTDNERYTSAKKSICPGVSMMFTFVFSHWKEVIPVWIVIPLWRSKSVLSVLVVPLSTLPNSVIAPLLYNKLSVKVVFPASTWAKTPILIIFMWFSSIQKPKRA